MTALQLMGIETPADFGGAESSFTAAIIAIEELAKVDPSVSVLCDVHNTLVNTVVRKYGTKEQQEKWLPKLAESSVRRPLHYLFQSVLKQLAPHSSAVSVSQNRLPAQTHSPFKHVPRKTVRTG